MNFRFRFSSFSLSLHSISMHYYFSGKILEEDSNLNNTFGNISAEVNICGFKVQICNRPNCIVQVICMTYTSCVLNVSLVLLYQQCRVSFSIKVPTFEVSCMTMPDNLSIACYLYGATQKNWKIQPSLAGWLFLGSKNC